MNIHNINSIAYVFVCEEVHCAANYDPNRFPEMCSVNLTFISVKNFQCNDTFILRIFPLCKCRWCVMHYYILGNNLSCRMLFPIEYLAMGKCFQVMLKIETGLYM